MRCKPEIVLNHQGKKPKIGVILIDWGVRESFHSLHYLNRQTIDRKDYELIWLEFYGRKPEGLQQMAAAGTDRAPVLDKWMVLGYPDDYLFHKHRVYNAGILVAEGDICVICDSDAVYQPTFLEKILKAFEETPNAVVHLDEVRNTNPAFYPFNYPDVNEIIHNGGINWRGETTLGLDQSKDMLHHANYGACMAAKRRDLLAIGGADEHSDYLGYVCGPYELTFRLLSYGRFERWLLDEFLYHTWHPNTYGVNTDYHGPHDGFHLSLLALEARATFRVKPYVQNPWLAKFRRDRILSTGQLLDLFSDHVPPAWKAGTQAASTEDRIYTVESNHYGFDIYHHARQWYAVRTGSKPFTPQRLRDGTYQELWQASGLPELKAQLPIDYQRWEAERKRGLLPTRLWKKFRDQPLHGLPARLARKTRRMLTF